MSVSPEDIASVRAAQEQMMPEAAIVHARQTVSDGKGGTKVTYTALPDPIPARVGHVKDEVRVAYAGQLRGKNGSMFTVPVGSPVNEEDRVGVLGGLYTVAADLSKSSYATAARYLIVEV